MDWQEVLVEVSRVRSATAAATSLVPIRSKTGLIGVLILYHDSKA